MFIVELFTIAKVTTGEGFAQEWHDLTTLQEVENNSKGDKYGSRETSEEATATIQAGDNGGQDWESNTGLLRSGWIQDMC